MASQSHPNVFVRQPPVTIPHAASSPHMRPRLGTLVGSSQAAHAASSLKVDCSVAKIRTGVNLENVTQRRRDRILDWPQFRLRRKLTSTPSNGLKRCKPDINTEVVAQRYPVKAVHPTVAKEGLINTVPAVISKPFNDRLAGDTQKNNQNETESDRFRPSPHCRRGISTNPHVRRRYSADGMPLQTDDVLAPSPAKRMYQQPGSKIPHASSMNLLSQDGYFSLEDNSNNLQENENVTLIRAPTWHRLLDRETRLQQENSDTPSGKTAQRPTAAKSETHIPSSSSKTPRRDQRQRRSSHLLSELRRSARQTLDTLCKALRNSTTNLTDSGKPEPQSKVVRRHSESVLAPLVPSPARSVIPIDANSLVRQPSQIQLPEQQVTKFVELKRSSLLEPFGLFVTKSDLGFRITRLSEQSSPHSCPVVTADLHVGDELIQVNGLQCSRLSLVELSEHFSERLTLLLTVRCKI